MSIATLQDIIKKFRRLTMSGTSVQITDPEIIDYINSYYIYDFPAEYRSLKLKDRYTFNTVRGIDTYPFDSEHYSTVQAPATIAKRQIRLFEDMWSFYGLNFAWQFMENITTGSGITGPYTGTLQAVPIVRSVNNNPMVQTTLSSTANFLSAPSKPSFPNSNISRIQNILITANSSLGSTQNVTDDGAGNLIGDGSGTINYDTGAINITFTNVVPAGENIQVQYNPANMNIPIAILFFQNQFVLRPVPDKGYTVEIVAYRLPSQALLGTVDPNTANMSGQPEQNEWWEILAFGAAKKFYQDKLDDDGENLMQDNLMDMLAKIETRTYAQLGKQRIQTMFADQRTDTYNNYGGFGLGPSGSGN